MTAAVTFHPNERHTITLHVKGHSLADIEAAARAFLGDDWEIDTVGGELWNSAHPGLPESAEWKGHITAFLKRAVKPANSAAGPPGEGDPPTPVGLYGGDADD